ncbi:hypothetical protein V6N13_113526 [Hibiscus sabdariffa]
MFGELSDYVFESTDDLGNVLWFKETSVLKLESGCRWGLNGRGRVPLNTKADDKLIAAGTMEVEDPVEPVAVDRMGGCDGGDDVGT